MTPLEIVFIVILWLILGFFICYKARWYKDEERSDDDILYSFLTVLLAPLIFAVDVFNIVFIKPWKND